ANTL
ncbi:putative carbamoyl-phosphate synthase, large subunit, partial [Vibrio parahaemolyticus EKP-028]